MALSYQLPDAPPPPNEPPPPEKLPLDDDGDDDEDQSDDPDELGKYDSWPNEGERPFLPLSPRTARRISMKMPPRIPIGMASEIPNTQSPSRIVTQSAASGRLVARCFHSLGSPVTTSMM